MSVKPLAGSVNDGLAAVGKLDAKLKGLKDGTCPIRDEFNDNFAGDAANGLSDGDRAKRPVGLTKGHYGRSTNKRANRLRDLTLQEEVGNFNDETQEMI